MVKVKDTQSFIERARELHGDLYDYSETVYVSARLPVEVICKRCGEKFRLAYALCHTGTKRCGCKKCNKEEMLVKNGSAKRCSQCGARRKYSHGNKKCRECINLGKDEWVDSLCKAQTRLLGKVHQRSMNGWVRWAKNKGCILVNRDDVDCCYYRLKSCVGSWEAWELKSVKKQAIRKVEDKWTKRLRSWAWALSRREKKQAGRS